MALPGASGYAAGAMMILRTTPTSPFGRKCAAAAQERGLMDRVRIEAFSADFLYGADSDVPHVNPLGKVPCLLLEDGSALYDSLVLCDYLHEIGGASRLLSQAGPARGEVLCHRKHVR